jgi:hypothetical protein
MSMLSVEGEPMSPAILGQYLDELSQSDRRILYKSEYRQLYDNTRSRITKQLVQAIEWWDIPDSDRACREILGILLLIEDTCRDRLAPDFWAKFECCRDYVQSVTETRTPSPHQERRGRDTPTKINK